MALVPKDYLTENTFRDVKFNMRTSCSICTEPFDSKVHIPKVLACGHSFCIKCIDTNLRSVQVSHVGDGEVMASFLCFVCRTSVAIPPRGAEGFANNFQLLEVIAPQDSRYMGCSSCKMDGSEASFHICRECTIEKHGYDVHTIVDEEPSLHPDTFAICSTCILKEHNVPGHTVIEYIPIRLDYQFKKNKMSVNVLNAQMAEKFGNVRTILAMLPVLVERKEVEVNKMVDFMQRAKNRQNQDLIFDKYKQEMNAIIKILDVLNNDGGKLNELVNAKVDILEKSNGEIDKLHCHPEPVNLREILKIPETIPEEVVPESSTDLLYEDIEQQERQVQEKQAASLNENEVVSNQKLDSVGIIEGARNNDSAVQILSTICETLYFQSCRLYRVISTGATNALTGNNENQDVPAALNNWGLVCAAYIFLAIIIMFTFLF